MSERLWVIWHRIRRHRAYYNQYGSACNTCDKDWSRRPWGGCAP
jgi:hypothetical protein